MLPTRAWLANPSGGAKLRVSDNTETIDETIDDVMTPSFPVLLARAVG
jgi:hypothetical protein